MGNAAPGREVSAIQSVDRAVTALEHLARRGEAGVGEVAEVIGVHKSSASRLLTALQGRGLVESTGERGRYRLGFGILRLAGSMNARLDLADQGRPVCDRLAEEVGETVNVAVRRGEHVINVWQSSGGGAITVDNWVGRPTPLHATSSGKILLAFAPTGEELPPLVRFTPATVTDATALAAELDTARSRGFAVTVEEYEIGLNAVAAPIRGADRVVVGALSVSGPAYRLSARRLVQIAGPVIEAAATIGRRMGFLD